MSVIQSTYLGFSTYDVVRFIVRRVSRPALCTYIKKKV